MSTTNSNPSNGNKPFATLRDGAIKATIWTNPGDAGRVRYSITLTRSYTDADGKWHDTPYFGRNELLRVARLAEKAYDAVNAAAGNAVNDADNGGSQ